MAALIKMGAKVVGQRAHRSSRWRGRELKNLFADII